jgi:RHS repeat-associated protein
VEQDALGRVTQIGDTTIEWEPFDRPRRIGATELRYSTLGVPVSRTIDGEATHFLFGGLVEAGPDMRPRTVVLGDVRIDLVDGTHEYLHRDARQNVAWVTDERGALVLARRFGPFGTRLVEGESRSLRGFAGGEELGPLVRIGARLHFPLAARFLSRDPLPGLGNRYTYAGGDPVNFWDPDGLTRTEVRRSARARFIIRPITGAEIELREEIIVDDPSAGSDDPGEDADPAAAPGAPSPGLFPEVPNHPAIPDVMLPPRFGGCDAIASSQGRVLGLLIALPFLILARSSPARRGRRGG